VSAVQSSNNAGVSQHLVDEVVAAAQSTQHVTAALSDAGPSVSRYRNTAQWLNVTQSFATLRTAQNQFVRALNAQRLG